MLNFGVFGAFVVWFGREYVLPGVLFFGVWVFRFGFWLLELVRMFG